MNKFYITGLPRSRTAWLANLLTYGTDSFCFHDPLRSPGARTREGLDQLFESTGASSCGLADHMLCFWPELVDGPLIVIDRDPAEVRPAVYKAFGKDGTDLIRESAKRIAALTPYMTVPYHELDSEAVVSRIWSVCLSGSIPWNRRRWQELRRLQVEVHPGRVLDDIAYPEEVI